MTLDATLSRPLPALPPLPPLPARPPGVRIVAPVGLNAAVVGRADLSPSVARFTIRPDELPPHVEPGQYFALGLVVDGQLLQRPYSTATRAGVHAELEFLIRRVPGGTLTPLLWDLAVGDRLRIGRPKGLFTRIADDSRVHLFIATGTGLAPFVAMIETMLREPAPPRAVVVHGVSHVAELAYRERFERWESDGLVRYVPSISRPDDPANAGWTGRTGRIDAILDEVCAAHDLAAHDTVAYLCGNPAMIAAGERILTSRRLPDDAIRSEHYWPA
jgi:ferredoxin--NADP+ reductase